ncbi:aldehyde dehydrogenase family protein, partial [Oenococcus oeni]|uniref:aldehyde dehydrogenase family protein n=1 Tax=Oenococcus oeni TaxID=1247 RepID=UPI00117EE8B7
MAYQTVSPYTNETIKKYDFSTQDDIERALSQGHTLYKKWRNGPLDKRVATLHTIAKLFREHEDELAKTAVNDMGKLLREAKGEVELCAMIAFCFAKKFSHVVNCGLCKFIFM